MREPVGVVGCITPWNYPLHQICAKVGPALTAGCSVVVKPSEVTPLTSFILAEIVDSLDLPAGVFNLVTGFGPVVGEAIAAHDDVDMVSFTGSTRAGRRVAEVAAGTVKRVALELGGKSANVILDDADLQKAVGYGVANCYLNSGQTCSAHTRMLVPREKLAEAEAVAQAAAEKATPGDPFEEGTRLGPLVSDAQRERVRGYIEKGQEEGAKLVTGGTEPPEGLDSGYFVRPTVFSEVKPDMTIAQEEIFGPVLSIIPYDSEDEAAEIANSTIYGLDGGVWSARPREGEGVREEDAHRPGADQRSHLQSSWRPSAATSSQAAAANTASSASRSSSRSSPFRSDAGELNYRARTAQARATAVRRRMPRSPMAVVKLPMWLLTKPNETPVSGSPQPPLPPNP